MIHITIVDTTGESRVISIKPGEELLLQPGEEILAINNNKTKQQNSIENDVGDEHDSVSFLNHSASTTTGSRVIQFAVDGQMVVKEFAYKLSSLEEAAESEPHAEQQLGFSESLPDSEAAKPSIIQHTSFFSKSSLQDFESHDLNISKTLPTLELFTPELTPVSLLSFTSLNPIAQFFETIGIKHHINQSILVESRFSDHKIPIHVEEAPPIVDVNRVISASLTDATNHFVTGTGADTFITTETQFSASDTIAAGGGTDTLRYMDRATITSDELSDKTGIDVIDFRDSGNSVTLSGSFVDAADSDSVELANGTYTITSLDTSSVNASHSVVIAGTGSVTLADGANNRVIAKDGVNTNVAGGSGDDTIVSGTGADTLNGGTGTDTLSYETDTSGVTVSLSSDSASGGNAAADTISNFENVTGGSAADSLTGSTAINAMVGSGGNDTLIGGYGGDTLSGGAGNDTLYADNLTFTSSSVSNLVVWLDASDVTANNTTHIGTTSTLELWADKSSQNNDFTDLTEGSNNDRASYTLGAINGRSAITFDTNDFLETTNTNILGNNSDYTQIAVLNRSTTNSNDTVIGLGTGGDQRLYASNGGSYRLQHGATNEATSNAVDDNNYIVGGTYSSSTTTSEFFVNGASQAVDTSTAGYTDGATMQVGTYEGSAFYDGDIAEILVFNNKVSAIELSQINEYLSYKYGVALDGLSFGADTLTGGTGADNFVWTNASHSGTGVNADAITDFNTSGGSYSAAEGDTIDISGMDMAYNIRGNFDTFSGTVNEIIWRQDSGDTNDALISIDFDGDSTADMEIRLDNFDHDDFTATQLITPTATYTGDTSGNTISGGGGNETQDGGRGADTLSGSSGNDTLIGGYGGDTLDGGSGNDVLYADSLNYTSSTIGSLVSWLDASDVNGDGSNFSGAVTTWQDKSSANNDFTDTSGGTSTDRPTYTADGINNRASLHFDGADFLETTNTNILGDDGDYTKIVVASRDVTNASHNFLSAGGTGTHALYAASGASHKMYHGGNESASTSSSATDAYVIGATYENSIGYSELFIDGTSADNDWSTADYTDSSSLQIGAYRGGSFLEGDVSEVLVFNRYLSAAELNTVYEYLAYKYDITISGLTFDNDTLTGGTGSDTFAWSNASHSNASNRDIVTDFNSSSGSFNAAEGDLIDLGTVSRGLMTVTGNSAFTSTANELIWTQSGAHAQVKIDFDGDGSADWEIQLSNFSISDLDFEDFSFENVAGTANADTVNVSSNAMNATIDAGAGNDTINLRSLSSLTNATSIDGGAGTNDTLSFLDTNQTLDLTAITDSQIDNIERLNLNNNTNTLTLTKADVLDVLDSGTTLTIDGGSNDAVTSSETWTKGAVGDTYTTYTNTGTTLFIDNTIDTADLIN